MTGTLNVGWEANPLCNSGANFYVTAARDITITGLQISIAMAPNGSPQFGTCQLLACAQVAPPGVAMGFGGPQGYPGFAPAQVNADFSEFQINNPTNTAVVGYVGYTGSLFSTILKTISQQAVNECIVRDGLSIAVPAGSTLVFHMDQSGIDGADCEMQGVINYQ